MQLIVNRHHLDLMPVVVLLLPMYAADCEQTSFRPHACCGVVSLTGRVMAKGPESCVLLGMQKRRLEFMPIDDLAINTDFV